ncbi:MAG: hypothetical protein NVS3B10_06410 [Polyangiales bacterium]
MGKHLDFALGVLNGAVGDYLARTGNGLAIEMECFVAGRPLPMTRAALTAAHPDASPRVVILLHGVMCTEQVWTLPDGDDYGAMLARDLGYTPLYVRYNSGLAIADSGASLDRLLTALVAAYPTPIDELLPIGFSMGGLVVRSACHAASVAGRPSTWLPLVRRAMYVGTPHLGAPLERLGRVVTRVLEAIPDPYTRLLAELGQLRSDGVKDLGDADLRHEDRARRRPHFALRDARHPVPMLPSIRHYLVAGSLWSDPRLAALFGDVLVPVASGTDGSCVDRDSLALPPSHVRVLRGVGHMDLAHHPDVYAHLRAWCEEPV